jgi:hypothetical protein
VSNSKDKICCSEGKVFGLASWYKSYVEGLDIISNIMTDQQILHLIQSNVWVIMLTHGQVFYYHACGMPHHHVVRLKVVILVAKVRAFLIS